ncbi:MAG: Uncharacterised protein [Prochlorococcus marinus str. MIT 9215]|nr:MAG: Uncharacterised protein [Prochlorococcus marinus str. MIT 9215]
MAPAQLLTGESRFFLSEGCPMHACCVAFVGRSVANGGGHLDDRWLVGDGLGRLDRFGNGIHIGVTISNVLHMPAIGFVALQHVLSEGDVCAAVDRDVIVVVEGNQLSELEMAGQGAGFGRNTFLITAITHHHIGVVINDVGVSFIELGGEVSFSNSQTYSIRDAGTEWACCDFNARRFKGFRVARCS